VEEGENEKGKRRRCSSFVQGKVQGKVQGVS